MRYVLDDIAFGAETEMPVTPRFRRGKWRYIRREQLLNPFSEIITYVR